MIGEDSDFLFLDEPQETREAFGHSVRGESGIGKADQRLILPNQLSNLICANRVVAVFRAKEDDSSAWSGEIEALFTDVVRRRRHLQHDIYSLATSRVFHWLRPVGFRVVDDDIGAQRFHNVEFFIGTGEGNDVSNPKDFTDLD